MGPDRALFLRLAKAQCTLLILCGIYQWKPPKLALSTGFAHQPLINNDIKNSSRMRTRIELLVIPFVSTHMEVLPMDILALDILPLAGLLLDMHLRLRLRLRHIGIGRTTKIPQLDDQTGTHYSSEHKAFHSAPPSCP
jgi:hypothetical protein